MEQIANNSECKSGCIECIPECRAALGIMMNLLTEDQWKIYQAQRRDWVITNAVAEKLPPADALP